MPEVTTPLRLVGPTGIRVGGETPWVRAYYRGVPLAGVAFCQARWIDDAGRSWLLQHVAYNWGAAVAREINEGETVDDGGTWKSC